MPPYCVVYFIFAWCQYTPYCFFVCFHSPIPVFMWAFPKVDMLKKYDIVILQLKTTPEHERIIIEMNNNLINAELLTKDRSKMTRQEKMQHIRDLEFERLALRNHWTEEEKKIHRDEFEAEKDREKKLLHNSIDVLTGNDENLSSFEKKQAENFIKENPDVQHITEGVIDLISEGRSDIENI